MLNCMNEVIEVLSEQIFEKLATIPYIIRQFCKCLYQSCKDKFPSEGANLQRVVGRFLLEKWMLKSAFVTLNMQGLIKEFILPNNCIQNLKLMYTILLKTMLWQDWEVQTPDFEKSSPYEPDLFVMTSEIAKIKEKSKVFFRDLLLLDKDLNSAQALSQDYDQVCDAENAKLNWHVVQLTMEQIKMLIDFFRILDKDKHKGVNNLVGRIDYYNEET